MGRPIRLKITVGSSRHYRAVRSRVPVSQQSHVKVTSRRLWTTRYEAKPNSLLADGAWRQVSWSVVARRQPANSATPATARLGLPSHLKGRDAATEAAMLHTASASASLPSASESVSTPVVPGDPELSDWVEACMRDLWSKYRAVDRDRSPLLRIYLQAKYTAPVQQGVIAILERWGNEHRDAPKVVSDIKHALLWQLCSGYKLTVREAALQAYQRLFNHGLRGNPTFCEVRNFGFAFNRQLPETITRQQALWDMCYLGWLREVSIERLLEVISHGVSGTVLRPVEVIRLRAEAAVELGRRHAWGQVDALIATLSDAEPMVRAAAAVGLQEMFSFGHWTGAQWWRRGVSLLVHDLIGIDDSYWYAEDRAGSALQDRFKKEQGVERITLLEVLYYFDSLFARRGL